MVIQNLTGGLFLLQKMNNTQEFVVSKIFLLEKEDLQNLPFLFILYLK